MGYYCCIYVCIYTGWRACCPSLPHVGFFCGNFWTRFGAAIILLFAGGTSCVCLCTPGSVAAVVAAVVDDGVGADVDVDVDDDVGAGAGVAAAAVALDVPARGSIVLVVM